jgi:hypothetical protein
MTVRAMAVRAVDAMIAGMPIAQEAPAGKVCDEIFCQHARAFQSCGGELNRRRIFKIA